MGLMLLKICSIYLNAESTDSKMGTKADVMFAMSQANKLALVAA